jgi:VanZ family protein
MGLLPYNASIPARLRPNDKVLHLATFFLLSLAFYWIPDTSRRRAMHTTLFVCTLILGIGSEVMQGLLPNGRPFDPFDVLANAVGSLGAVGLCSWYHRRMLERRRKARFGALADGRGEDDVELGVGTGGEAVPDRGTSGQETGVMSLEQELENWDENAVDSWDTEDGPGPDADGNLLAGSNLNGGGPPTSPEVANLAPAKKSNE